MDEKSVSHKINELRGQCCCEEFSTLDWPGRCLMCKAADMIESLSRETHEMAGAILEVQIQMQESIRKLDKGRRGDDYHK